MNQKYFILFFFFGFGPLILCYLFHFFCFVVGMFELSLLGCDDSLRFYLPPFTFLFRLRFVWFTRRTAHAIAIQKPCCPWSLCVLCLKKNWTSSVTIRRIWLADGRGGRRGRREIKMSSFGFRRRDLQPFCCIWKKKRRIL